MADPARILLVDDDEAFVESNRDLLEACGYEVHSASNGHDGYETALRVRPDVLVLDVMMTTDTEGFEVARRMAATPELQPLGILLVTGVSQALSLPHRPEPDAAWLPVDRVMEKPIDPARLIKEIERVLKDKQAAPPAPPTETNDERDPPNPAD
jgi:two-component system alkaline phosphatase synthesis response regulator PhoP